MQVKVNGSEYFTKDEEVNIPEYILTYKGNNKKSTYK